MIAVPPRILFARRPVDFRKQIDGLAAVCERELGEAPLDGTLFLFTNRVRMTAAELAALLEGIDLSNARRLKRWNPDNSLGDGREPG